MLPFVTAKARRTSPTGLLVLFFGGFGLFGRLGARFGTQLVVLGGAGHGDDLHILVHADEAHALGVSAADTDVLHAHADDHTGIVDDQQVVVHGDAADAHQRTGLVGEVVSGNTAAAAMVLGVLLGQGQLAVAVVILGKAILYIAPILMLSGIVCGALTGTIFRYVYPLLHRHTNRLSNHFIND